MTQIYEQATDTERSRLVKSRYNQMKVEDAYATSRDVHLRELEINHLVKQLEQLPTHGQTLLDVGCGNGYTDIRLAWRFNLAITGVDFSENMVRAAHKLRLNWQPLKGSVNFLCRDATQLDLGNFDYILTERFLLNLPSRTVQEAMLKQIANMLKPDGVYFQIEGSKDGLTRLNQLRIAVGLPPIPDRDEDNFSSLKFNEERLGETMRNHGFTLMDKHYFSTYYFISRILHPLFMKPQTPKFRSKFNEVARLLAEVYEIDDCLGHVAAWTWRKTM